jgi:CheY-like chemotaxis protein
MGESIVLRSDLDPQLGRIKADPRRLDWVFLNLAMNAHQETSSVSELHIATRNVELEHEEAGEMGVVPGAYVLVEITGASAAPPQPKIAEIIRQSEGALAVREENGVTILRIVLPSLDAGDRPRRIPSRGSGAGPMILVVEDDRWIRENLCSAIENAGYEVLEASDGKEAESVLAACRVDLMITDIVMPEQDGLQTIISARKKYPALKIVAISAIAEGHHLTAARLLGAHCVMSKPVTGDALLRALRTELRLPPE